ncbi:MAG: HEPN domain-containing protein [bacterium]
MLNSIQHFKTNINRVKEIGGLYDALSGLTTSIIDASDLLRSQIVMTVNALDHYIHEVTRHGMLEIFDGNRSPTDAFLKFQVSMETLQQLSVSLGASRALLENEIREKHSYLSFQHPDKIGDAIRLFYSPPLWPEVASSLSFSVNDVKTTLKLIVERRNKIAHEADMDPSYPGTRWPITKNDVQMTINFIENVCESIHSTIIIR